MSFLHTMKGPDFLALYAGWFLITWTGMFVYRHRVADTWLATLTGMGLFDGLGLARYVAGKAHGMHRWEFLVVMMALGSLFFLLRASNFSNGSSSGWSSCGGGGGGGGCGGGGGGCGGCGGS